ncbi:MAG: 16S rRNA (cytidine(1402)-2'-O)-methyltransferase [Candidatus Omnitrophica bacterium]|nr:16S rRNA (cytidine(1402)-2'-O)-methyltransferase [Candidatus Omnitrophota bacterium]
MLYLVATPIGNLEDITLRAVRILGEVDLILCEDTRKTGLLLQHFNIKKPLISFFEHNELRKIPQVVEGLKKEQNIALVSSAGTPTISDPGYKLIRECRKQNLPVTSLPGASSLINAIALTSLPHEKFVFLGYLPRKKSACQRLLEEVKGWDVTVVFLESPYRLIKSLGIIREVFGNRKVAVAREMTKKFEEIREASPGDLLAYFSSKPPKGEMVVIIPGQEPAERHK